MYGDNGGFTPQQMRVLRAVQDEQREKLKGGRFWRTLDFLLYLLIVIMIALGIRAFLFEPIRVDGTSMIPTLIHGEHMFVEKISFWVEPPKRGEIIICYYPGYTESCVKRVIGLPGETVAIEGGAVYIDGAAIDEADYWADTIWEDMAPVTVPDGAVFVIGDNRNGSKDSRNPSVGAIPYGKIVGRVRAVIWPLSRFRLMDEVSYG